MRKILTAIVMFSTLGWLAPTYAQVTEAQCSRDYDACKKKHVFDKKPCRKKRDDCQLQVIQQNADAQKTATKNRMMGVTTEPQPGTSMRDRVNGTPNLTEAQRKAQAAQRIRARQEANSRTGTGMRDNVQSN